MYMCVHSNVYVCITKNKDRIYIYIYICTYMYMYICTCVDIYKIYPTKMTKMTRHLVPATH